MGKKDKSPDEVVRFPVAISVADRARLRIVAAHLGRPMEDVAGEWLVARLAQEESRLGIAKRGR